MFPVPRKTRKVRTYASWTRSSSKRGKCSDPTQPFPEYYLRDTTGLHGPDADRSSRSSGAIPSRCLARRKRFRCTKVCAVGRRWSAQSQRVPQDEVRHGISGGAPSPVVVVITALRERVGRTGPRPFGLLVATMRPEESELHGVRALHPGEVVRDGRNALQRSKCSVRESWQHNAGAHRPWEPSTVARLISPADHVRNHRSNSRIPERIRHVIIHLVASTAPRSLDVQDSGKRCS